MNNLIFIAPPAAGKGTQAKLLCEKYGYHHISTGDLLRKASVTDEVIKEKINAGQFIGDSIMLELIKKEIETANGGYILDGFPRNMEQARAFDAMVKDPYRVIYIQVSKEVAQSRILGRLYCPSCGANYNENVGENIPKKTNECDRCHSMLVKREDDNVRTFMSRFNAYVLHTKPLIDYYLNKQVLYTVDGDSSSTKVHDEIVKIVEGEL